MTSPALSPEAKAALLELRQWRRTRPVETASAEERARSLDQVVDICTRLARYGPPAVQEQVRAEAERHRREARALREEATLPDT
ncbi:hypothetical protein [Nocardiopsis ansamitocini]|uniref:Uncharacterized protein n=1 Tax=Nocardiopsis ansamitocini TaxID=1670832 RepID=A0A9W6UIM6_9ACTN|nr:hypothetical protein [Nocardiopsis ansamitocini]GLU50086.1 hypothetical protein Nans01_44370 [Nocardiopsis ansamitocini]